MLTRTFQFSHFQLGLLYFQDAQRNVQPSFIVDDSDDEDMVDDAVEEESDDDDVFDSVCAFCDNGGNIIWYSFSVLSCQMYILGNALKC